MRSLDTLCFVINFTLATLVFIACAVSIAAADNPFSFFGGLLFAFPAACYAGAEWVCWYRKRYWLHRQLGILNLLAAAFFAFAMVTTVGEAFLTDEPIDVGFILIFGFNFAFVSGYLAWCGWRRFHSFPYLSEVIHERR